MIDRRSEESSTGYLYASQSSSSKPRLLGLCTGLIAASAIASASTLSALLPLAVETVRLSFRLGAHVGKIAAQLDQATSTQETWSMIIPNIDRASTDEILAQFHTQNVSL